MVAAALSPVVDRVVAAGVMPGGVTMIEYGEKAYFAFVGTVVVGFQVTLLTRWVQPKREVAAMWDEFRSLTILLGGAGLVAAPILLFGGRVVARVLLGAHLAVNVPAAPLLIGFYLVAIIPYTIGGIAVRVLFARNDTKPILELGILKLCANLIGDLVFSLWIGLPGIALATVVAESLVAVRAFVYARRNLLATSPAPAT